MSVVWVRVTRVFSRFHFGLLASLLLCVAVALAQSDTGSIAGYIKDPSGSVIPKAKVTLTNEGTGETHALITDAAGYYVVPNLPPAFYALTVEAPGFKRFESGDSGHQLVPALPLRRDISR